MIKVVHLTPHMGGGVGKALSGLITQAIVSKAPVRHVVVCLEHPEKNQFLDIARESGAELVVAPSTSSLNELIAGADIVQLEWWNHPTTIECLCRLAPHPIRLLAWCHVSGLYNPIIPTGLMQVAHRFLFTSPCSFEAKQVSQLAPMLGNRLAVVSSGGGFSSLPEPALEVSDALSVGYLGSLNFAKLHPDYVRYLSAVRRPDFKVKLIGDEVNREVLEKQCSDAGRAGMLDFRGYTTSIATELGAINVLAYLLNPCHYGTAENALLEAMAMGVVPVVLNNPAERHIVEHERTGLVVNSPSEFADAIEYLAEHPEERCAIGMRAAATVRSQYTVEKMEAAFRGHYGAIMQDQKRPIVFQEIFGTTPDQWFLSCQPAPELFGENGRVRLPPEVLGSFNFLEKTKGSVFHFNSSFPDNGKLREWSKTLEALR